MAVFLDNYNYVFYDLADSRVKDWWHFGGPWSPIATICLYLYVVYSWLPNYMENKKPFSLKTITQVYNVIQVICCAALIYGLLTSGWNNYAWGCQPIDYSQNPLALRALNIVSWIYFLKIAELLETVFFTLRKKHNQVTKLHVYHHTSMIIIMWLGTKYAGGGMLTFPLLLNNFVHILMYSYYFLCTMGPNMQRKLASLKPKLTILQMIQFSIDILHGVRPLMSDCNESMIFFWLITPNVTFNFVLFLNFFAESYSHISKKET